MITPAPLPHVGWCETVVMRWSPDIYLTLLKGSIYHSETQRTPGTHQNVPESEMSPTIADTSDVVAPKSDSKNRTVPESAFSYYFWLLLRLIYFCMSYCPLLEFHFPDFCILPSILAGVMPLCYLLGSVGDMYYFSNTYRILVYINIKYISACYLT